MDANKITVKFLLKGAVAFVVIVPQVFAAIPLALIIVMAQALIDVSNKILSGMVAITEAIDRALNG